MILVVILVSEVLKFHAFVSVERPLPKLMVIV